MIDPKLTRALTSFDAHGFATRHGGHKETPSIHTHEYLLPCPSCGSERLRWNDQKHTFICWGCKMTGSTLFLVQIMEKCDELGAIGFVMDGYVGGDSKIDSLEELIPRFVPSVVTKARPLAPLSWPSTVDMLGEPCEPHGAAWAYLARRGVTTAQVRAWRLGYGRHGRLGGYVVFPCFIDGALVYYQGRATWDPPEGLSHAERKAWEKETGYRKTLNPSSKDGHASAGDVLLGYDNARRLNHIVIVEGPFDALKVGTHAVALLGKVLTDVKLDRLMRTNAQRFTVYLDRGAEEQAIARKMAAQLSAFGEVFIAVPPEGYDPGKLTPEQNAFIIDNAERFRSGVLSSVLKP